MSNKLLGYIKEKELTHDDVIAMIDEHLQVQDTEEGEPIEEEEVVDDESITNTDNSTPNDEVDENDEIEQFSSSQMKLLEDLETKIKELTKSVSKIKRKTPPKGETSDKALHNREAIKKNWYEADI